MKPRLFDEIVEGFQSFADHRAGKITLNTYVVEVPDAPTLTARQLLALRNKLNVSRAVFASYLRTNVRTLENWEQGRAKPNAQATVLIQLIAKHKDMLKRLQEL